MTSSTSILSNTQAVIGDDGRVSLSNISSGGIDFDSITDALVKAKRAPAVKLEKNIESNSSIISDFKSLNSSTKSLANTLESLRGSTSSFTTNVFSQRSGTVQTYAASGAPNGHVPSPSSDIVSIAVEKGAAKGSHSIEVLQKATAHQIRGDAITSKYDDISTLSPAIAPGSFTVNGVEINVTDSDSLYEIAEKINNANEGLTPTGISATIITASDTEHYIVLSSDKTGTDNTINLGVVAGEEAESEAILNALGLTTGTGVSWGIKNETTTPQNAKLDVNGLGIVIERQSNTVDDVLEGISFDIIKAEEGTIIEVEIDSDLSSVKQGIIDFVDAYNEVREIINEQQTSKPRKLDEDGNVIKDAENEFGTLAFNSIFRQFAQEFTQLGSFSNFNLDDGFRSLSQIGISITSEGMLEINDEDLDAKIVENVDQIEKLFSFSMTTSDTNIGYIANSSKTQPNVDINGNIVPYYLTIEGTDADGNITNASLRTGPGESDYLDGSVSISGNVLTFTDATGAEGLKIIYNGGKNMGSVTDIEITPTRGIADSFYYVQKEYTMTSSGQFDKSVTTLSERNDQLEGNISNIDARVDRYRDLLEAKFTATETAMSLSNSILEQLKQQFEAMNSKN